MRGGNGAVNTQALGGSMSKTKFLVSLCALVLAGITSASAATRFVDARTGTGSLCTITAPCADVNTALSISACGDNIVILVGAVFGPVKLTCQFSIAGTEPPPDTQFVNDGSAPGCIGGAPGSCGSNSGWTVEVAAGDTDTIKLSYVTIVAGSGQGALKFTSGGKIQFTHDVYRGNGTSTGALVALYPANSSAQAQVYFSNSDVGFHNGGAVEIKPSGTTSVKLHFNHVEVHNANFGIRSDASLLASSSNVVATVISDSEFFSFPSTSAAINAFSTSGTGTVQAVFVRTQILNSGTALKANGPQSFVVLNDNTACGNGIGIQVLNSAVVNTMQNNTVKCNNTNISGTLNPLTFD